ncbi:envelope stress response membrane protein PspC [Azospirillum halopraeferens]|uniref:envelope stress response membrane protein PspC n=1 Tax=Azospirillum halopraeferens TaxID=34010 RepID=UPI000413A134|nr:envelope stress response membrane protein PspC [Azospirillum halopraeferens]
MTNPSPYDSPNPHRLYRIPEDGYVAGVCAGVADYFGVQPFLVRLAVIVGVFAFTPLVLPAYVVAALALPRRPAQVYRTPEEEVFWRSVTTKPDRTLAGLSHRFRDFEKRIGTMETYVTSEERTLNRAIRDLDR